MKKNLSVVILFAALITGILGNGAPKNKRKINVKRVEIREENEKIMNLKNYNGIKKISIFVKGFESGPTVSKIIMELQGLIKMTGKLRRMELRER